jgi:hypothetical protein
VSLFCCECRMTFQPEHERSECKVLEEDDYGLFQDTITVFVWIDQEIEKELLTL